MKSELCQCWRMSSTGKFEDQGGTTSSETRAVLLRVIQWNRDVPAPACQDPRSFRGSVLPIISLKAERTQKHAGDLESAGSARVESSLTLQLAVGVCCPQSPCEHQSSDSGSEQPPRSAADEPGTKRSFTVSGVVSSQQRGRYSASFQGQSLSAEKSQSDQPSQIITIIFFSQDFVNLASNKII